MSILQSLEKENPGFPIQEQVYQGETSSFSDLGYLVYGRTIGALKHS